MKYALLGLGALTIAACDYLPGGGPATAPVAPDRVNLFVATVEAAGCTLPQAENDHLLDPAGFSDAEASAISQRLLAEGRAEITPNGDLALLTANCA